MRHTLSNVHEITQTAKDQTVVQVNEVLDKTITALANIQVIVQQFKTITVSQQPVLERFLANLQLSSDQLKLAAIEVRRSPWRLMYEPDDKELATDNLYDAARSFAMAASQLDTTAQSLQAATDNRNVDSSQVEKILNHLNLVFSKFKEAETSFWKAIKVEPLEPSKDP